MFDNNPANVSFLDYLLGPIEQLTALGMKRFPPRVFRHDCLLMSSDSLCILSTRTESSPLYGMPILEVDRAPAIIVLKRSMRPGFAGVDNELYYDPKCMMLFGDAKDSLTKLLAVLK
jgi:NAD(P) transhydrogenase beta subunit